MQGAFIRTFLISDFVQQVKQCLTLILLSGCAQSMTHSLHIFVNFCYKSLKISKVFQKNADNYFVRNFRKGKKRNFVLVVVKDGMLWATMNMK